MSPARKIIVTLCWIATLAFWPWVRVEAAPDLISVCQSTADLEALTVWSVSHATSQAVAIIPTDFFQGGQPDWRPSPDLLQALRQESVQIALPLPGSPILPLVWDTRVAQPADVPDDRWPRFSSPEDVRSDLAEAYTRYRNFFGVPPLGLILPGGALSPDVARELDRLHFKWVVMDSSGVWSWSLLSDLGMSRDYSRWIGSPDQQIAWEALGQARKAIEQYQDSGHSDLNRLDAAVHEAQILEGSEFFETLDEDHRRQFTATLSGIYQMIGQPPPPDLDSLFSRHPAPAGPGTLTGNARVFSGPDWIRWVDDAGDDHGPGNFQYPTGAYALGSWDIRDAEIHWDDSAVTMLFHFTSLGNPWGAPSGFSLPVIDVYIDLNHVLGAGCETLLTGRNARVAPEDAWEYALSITGWGGYLYRSTSRTEFTRVRAVVVQYVKDKAEISVVIPRNIFRGDPLNWGYAIGVSGKGHSHPTDPLDLMPIALQAGPDAFGGASPGKRPASFVDIMVPDGVSQADVLSSYASDRPVVLPMIRIQ